MNSFNHRHIRVSDKKKYLLFSQLHSLLNAGLSFSRSFTMLIDGEKGKKESVLLKRIYDHVIEGHEFWQSMKISDAFTDLDCGVIRIGEETGKLQQSLLFLSDYYRKKNEQRRMLIGALSYPMIIVVVALLVLSFMIAVVIPMFEQIYSRMGNQLPDVTRFMLRVSAAFPSVLTLLGCLILILVGIRLIYGDREEYRRITSEFCLKIPLIGRLIRVHYQAQFCKLLYLLVSSEVSLLTSLSMLESIICFYPYSRSFNKMSDGLRRGESFSDNMDNFRDLYGTKLLTLIRVGEETNSLDEMLLNQSKDITEELEHELKQLGNVLEPILILIIGAIVAFILIAMYMPMFQLGQNFNG